MQITHTIFSTGTEINIIKTHKYKNRGEVKRLHTLTQNWQTHKQSKTHRIKLYKTTGRQLKTTTTTYSTTNYNSCKKRNKQVKYNTLLKTTYINHMAGNV